MVSQQATGGHGISNTTHSPHDARFIDSPAGKGLVMFIHGFMGSPGQFSGLTEVVHREGYAAACLLLPGHNCSARAFASGTAETWQRHVDAEISRYSRDYSDIILVGHSMGGLLALNAAVRFSDHVRGAFIIASPFKLAVFSVKASLSRIRFVLSRKSDPKKAVSLAGISVKITPGLILHIVKPFRELKKLMKTTKNILPDVRVPVTAVYSRSDELSSFASLGILRSGLGDTLFGQVVLSKASHAYFPENERVMIETALIDALHNCSLAE